MKEQQNGTIIAIGSDHAAFETKTALVKQLTQDGFRVVDVGTQSEESVDYPDYAFQVGKLVASGRADRGILACGTGIGMCIAANKVKGIRAAVVWSKDSARLASEHNWANVLCLSGRLTSIANNKKFVQI